MFNFDSSAIVNVLSGETWANCRLIGGELSQLRLTGLLSIRNVQSLNANP
jgi:hypothetical protein